MSACTSMMTAVQPLKSVLMSASATTRRQPNAMRDELMEAIHEDAQAPTSTQRDEGMRVLSLLSLRGTVAADEEGSPPPLIFFA